MYRESGCDATAEREAVRDPITFRRGLVDLVGVS
jgi:hypothetical protein